MNNQELELLNQNAITAKCDIQELVKGCTNAIVMHSLEDNKTIVYPTKKYQTHKIVVLFDDRFCKETINKYILHMMMAHSQHIAKSFFYKLKSGSWLVSAFNFLAHQFRSIVGFTANADVVDYRKEYKDFNKKNL